MDGLTIMDKIVPFSFLIGKDPDKPDLDRDALRKAAGEMADAVHSVAWEAPYDQAFQAMNAIVFFNGSIPFNGATVSRPFSDQPNGVFYWQAGEFMNEWEPSWRATYYLHDCWHVMQFRERGLSADLHEEIDREVDAMDRQIEVANILNCGPTLLKFLTDYRADRNAIEARIKDGFVPGVPCTQCKAGPEMKAPAADA